MMRQDLPQQKVHENVSENKKKNKPTTLTTITTEAMIKTTPTTRTNNDVDDGGKNADDDNKEKVRRRRNSVHEINMKKTPHTEIIVFMKMRRANMKNRPQQQQQLQKYGVTCKERVLDESFLFAL